MKKTTSLFVLLTVIASLSLTACATQEEAPDLNVDTPAVEPTEEPIESPVNSE